MRCLATIGMLSVLLSSCLVLIQPPRVFYEEQNPAPPDYENPSHWAALPWKQDNADLVPSGTGLSDKQERARADVFFIHPTTFISPTSWNAGVSNPFINRITDGTTILHQASVFNGSCRVFAPRYRQATLYSFFDLENSGKKALDLAYEDIRTAFEYYLEHYNNGRPIIIAAHSQGSYHGVRLLRDYFDSWPLQERLIAAYLPGMPVPENTFRSIPPCDSSGQTGCFITWNTVGWGSKIDFLGNSVCVNPLTWNRTPGHADAARNLGGVRRSFDGIDPYVTDAKASEGHLWIHAPRTKGYSTLAKDNYHTLDYNLFYMNIRENAACRIQRFLSEHPEYREGKVLSLNQ